MCYLCKHTHNKKKKTIHSPSKTSDNGRRRGKKEKEGRDVLVSDIQAWKSVRCNLVVHRPFSSVRVSSCSRRWTISMRRRSSQCAPCWSDYDRQQTFKKGQKKKLKMTHMIRSDHKRATMKTRNRIHTCGVAASKSNQIVKADKRIRNRKHTCNGARSKELDSGSSSSASSPFSLDSSLHIFLWEKDNSAWTHRFPF